MTEANPIKPSQFRALVPPADATVCDVLIRFFKFVVLFFRYYSWMYRIESGQVVFSEEYRNMLCSAMRGCGNQQI